MDVGCELLLGFERIYHMPRPTGDERIFHAITSNGANPRWRRVDDEPRRVGAAADAVHSAATAPGGRGGGLNFTQPSPMDFNDHDGYVSLFDGVSLEGWDGNPKFWRVEDGAIVGESTPAEPERQQLHRLPRASRRRTSR